MVEQRVRERVQPAAGALRDGYRHGLLSFLVTAGDPKRAGVGAAECHDKGWQQTDDPVRLLP